LTISTADCPSSVLRSTRHTDKNMNFTSDIKKEIISRGSGRRKRGEAERKAALSAFVRTSGFIGIRNGTPSFFIVSETENVAEFFMSSFLETFGVELSVTNATMDRMSGRDKLLLQCPPTFSAQALEALELLNKNGGIKEGISARLVQDEKAKASYIRGAFLGGGSCTVPSENTKSGYHLEIVFYDKKTAWDFCELLEEFELLARLIERKDSFVVYVKSKEVISDFLAIIGAENCLRKFSAIVDKRDRANNNNRAQNCISGNADKAASAAVKQVLAIEKIKNSAVYETLSDELKALAKTRLLHPEKSLQELADYLKVSKSCLNHRMRKLIELSEKTEPEKK